MIKKIEVASIGLLCGFLLFRVIEPAMLGNRPSPLFDREAAIFFIFRLFPLMIIPSVCLIIAAFRPASRIQAFRLGGILAVAMLVPLPILDEWRTIPSLYGHATFSSNVLIEILVLGGTLVVLSIIAAAIAGLVSPFIDRHVWLGKR